MHFVVAPFAILAYIYNNGNGQEPKRRGKAMGSIIDDNSFVAAEVQPEHGFWIEGVVSVTLRGETKTVRAHMRQASKEITAFGLTGRYETGTKAWPASVTQKIDPRSGARWDSVDFGRDDRSPKFSKMRGLSFA